MARNDSQPGSALKRRQVGKPHIDASIEQPRQERHGTAASRSWRASLIRKRAQVLGVVEAASREAAEAAAVRTFGLGNEQRKRLVVQERGPFSA
jgi:hypothetical protein